MNKRQMLRTIFSIVGFFVVPMSQSLASTLPQPAASVVPLNKVIATVNGEPITAHRFSEFYERAQKRVKAMSKSGQAMPAPAQLRAYIMQQYINRVLQLQMAKRAGIKVTKKQIDQQIQHILKQRQLSLAAFEKMLGQQGYTLSEFKRELKAEMQIGMLQRQAVGSDVDVSSAAVKKFQAQLATQSAYAPTYHVVDVHVPLNDDASPADKKAALAKATAFKHALLQHKPVPDGYRDDLGWQGANGLPTVFMSALSQHKGPGVVGPVEAANGYHVLNVLAVKPAKQPMPTKAQVMQMLYMQKLQAASKKWLANIRAQSDVKVYK